MFCDASGPASATEQQLEPGLAGLVCVGSLPHAASTNSATAQLFATNLARRSGGPSCPIRRNALGFIGCSIRHTIVPQLRHRQGRFVSLSAHERSAIAWMKRLHATRRSNSGVSALGRSRRRSGARARRHVPRACSCRTWRSASHGTARSPRPICPRAPTWTRSDTHCA
jgi:hypothetical protein